MDSKDSTSTLNQVMRGCSDSPLAAVRTTSSTKAGLAKAASVTNFSS